MPRFSRRTVIIIAVILLLLIALAAVTANEREDISAPESVTRDVLVPAKGFFASLWDKLAAIPNYFSNSKNIRAENEALKEELAELRLRLDQLEDASVTNAYLRDMLGLADDIEEWEPLATTVIARNTDSWYRTVTIRGGQNRGFEKNMPVITTEGLIGRISSVSQYSSEVLLLTDKDCAVAAIVRLSQTPGVIEGTGENDRVYMIHLPADMLLGKDQAVVSSGLGGVFPSGLRIGYIIDMEPDAGGLTQRATVQLYADMSRIDNVFVLTKIPEYALNNANDLGKELTGGDEENEDGDPSGENETNEGETEPEGE